MIKYIPEDITIGLREIPDEITLCINISECQNHCPECHSKYLWGPVGEELTEEVVDKLIDGHDGITCVGFMGEGHDPERLQELILHTEKNHPGLKIGLYSGREEVGEDFYWEHLSYLKTGPFKSEYGPLDKETTNQRLYERTFYNPTRFIMLKDGKMHRNWLDVTHRFWRKN